MGEAVQKKNKNENEKNGGGGGEGKKKEENPVTVVLKVDMHCEGCANKIIKCVKGFEGVQTVKAEIQANKLTIGGKMDPSKLREKLASKTKKKVDLISPQPKKDKDSNSKPDDASNNKSDQKTDEKKKPKEKEPSMTMAVLKVGLHCQGCIEKIHRLTSKFKGVQEMSVDKQKDLITVKGTMDVKALSESLSERLKRPVVIVPPKKEKEKDKDGGGGDKKEGGGGEKNEGGVGKKKKKGGSGGGAVAAVGGGGGDGDGDQGGGGNGGGGKLEGNKMEYMPMAAPGYGYGYGYTYGYGYGYGPGGLVGEHLHAPQMFSDENPNACSIM